MQFAAGDGRLYPAAQLGHAVPVVHVERLLEPLDAELIAAEGERRSALEVPVRVWPEQRHRPALVCVDGDREVVADRGADTAHDR